MNIRRLSEHTINQIAAGEVIERPASVVKELVENSIDACSTRIEIDVVNGGKKLIKVIDNGSGIQEEDMGMAFEKHTTSKIKDIEDVYSLRTMGFRGEALASIASVAKVEAVSKDSRSTSDMGKHIFIKGGKLMYDERIHAQDGTSIKVMDLFFNMPARKKYMKTTSTELKHITKVVTGLAIINPGIHFILRNNQRIILNLPSCEDELENLFHIMGAETARNMVPLECALGSIRVSGFIGDPSLARGTRSGEWFFVNGRHVKSKVVKEGLEDAFKGTLMRKKYPIAVISIKVDPREMDVNIHPTKKEIKFEKEDGIYAAVYEAVSRALEKKGVNIKGQRAPGSLEGENDLVDTIRESMDGTSREISPFQTTLMENPLSSPNKQKGIEGEDEWWEREFGFEPKLYNDYRENFHRHGLPLLYPIAQIHNLYIIARSQDGLIVIDQHALHERIMLEKVTGQYSRRAMAMQELIVPLDIGLSSVQSATFDEWKDSLARIGFGIEHFGGDQYRVRYIPASIQLREAKKLVLDIIDKLVEEGKDVSLEEMEEEILKMTACRSAIKAGEPLDKNGMYELFSQMYRANNPYFCAHGRPTMVKISLGELEKRFKRKV